MAAVKVNPANVHEFADFGRRSRPGWRSITTEADERLDQAPQGQVRAALDHAEGSDRRCAVLGLDRRHPQGLRREQLSAAVHAEAAQEHLEQDQRRERRAAGRRGPHDRARAARSRGGEEGRPLGNGPTRGGRRDGAARRTLAAAGSMPILVGEQATRTRRCSAQIPLCASAFRLHNLKTRGTRASAKIGEFVEHARASAQDDLPCTRKTSEPGFPRSAGRRRSPAARCRRARATTG